MLLVLLVLVILAGIALALLVAGIRRANRALDNADPIRFVGAYSNYLAKEIHE